MPNGHEPIAFKPVSGYEEQLYTPDVAKKEYFPTKGEWVADNFKQLIFGISIFGSNSWDLIEGNVPEGYVFYLTSAQLSLKTGVNASTTTLSIFGTTDDVIMRIYATPTSHEQSAQSFPMPIKINSGSGIRLVNSGALATGFGCIQGYFEKKV